MVKEHRKGLSTAVEKMPRLRNCIVQNVEKPSNEMIRFVLNPADEVVPDLKACLPGRGVWVSASRKNIDIALEKGLFARKFKKKVQINDNLSDLIEDLLVQKAMQALSLSAKAGLVVTGFEKVQAVLGSKKLCGVLFACDGSKDSIGKIRSKLKNDTGAGKIALHHCLLNSQLALALGRANVIHAALLKGGAAEMCLTALKRLEYFRSVIAVEDIGNKETGR